MTTFIVILGIFLAIGGSILLVMTDGDMGMAWVIFGFTIIFFVAIDRIYNDAPKSEPIITNAILIPTDSIVEIKFVISDISEDGIWCGQNIKLKGRTEKNIGDTITIKLPN